MLKKMNDIYEQSPDKKELERKFILTKSIESKSLTNDRPNSNSNGSIKFIPKND
jgi:hypothetical protein